MTTKTHLFWANGDLSLIEQLSIISFMKEGYDVTLWSYQPLGNTPKGVKTADASTLIPASKMFLVNGSLAPFADILRLKILNTHGGLWSDADVVAIRPEYEMPQEPFFVTEDIWEGSWRKDRPWVITNCIIHNPNPEEGNLVDLFYHYAERFPKDKIQWGELGPSLLHNLSEIVPNHGYAIQPIAFGNSIKAGEITDTVLKPGEIDPDAQFLHLYNDMWRRAGIDKHNLKVPHDSILGKLVDKYLDDKSSLV